MRLFIFNQTDVSLSLILVSDEEHKFLEGLFSTFKELLSALNDNLNIDCDCEVGTRRRDASSTGLNICSSCCFLKVLLGDIF